MQKAWLACPDQHRRIICGAAARRFGRTTMAVLTATRRTVRLARSWPMLLLGLALGAGLLLLVMLASIGFGAANIRPADVWAAIFAFDPSSTDHLIIRTLRVPRALVGALVGAALAVAGAVMQ